LKRVVALAVAETLRLVALCIALGFAPMPRSDSNEAIVHAAIVPIASIGVVAYLGLTSWISSAAPRYGMVSTILQALLIVGGLSLLLDYWSVLR
jgi:hypothetical protein